jgi:hypothetical protein
MSDDDYRTPSDEEHDFVEYLEKDIERSIAERRKYKERHRAERRRDDVRMWAGFAFLGGLIIALQQEPGHLVYGGGVIMLGAAALWWWWFGPRRDGQMTDDDYRTLSDEERQERLRRENRRRQVMMQAAGVFLLGFIIDMMLGYGEHAVGVAIMLGAVALTWPVRRANETGWYVWVMAIVVIWYVGRDLGFSLLGPWW